MEQKINDHLPWLRRWRLAHIMISTFGTLGDKKAAKMSSIVCEGATAAPKGDRQIQIEQPERKDASAT